MREEQERADDRRDAAQEMITLNRLGRRAVRCKILVWPIAWKMPDASEYVVKRDLD